LRTPWVLVRDHMRHPPESSSVTKTCMIFFVCANHKNVDIHNVQRRNFSLMPLIASNTVTAFKVFVLTANQRSIKYIPAIPDLLTLLQFFSASIGLGMWEAQSPCTGNYFAFFSVQKRTMAKAFFRGWWINHGAFLTISTDFDTSDPGFNAKRNRYHLINHLLKPFHILLFMPMRAPALIQ
jgi:hypothetical protein